MTRAPSNGLATPKKAAKAALPMVAPEVMRAAPGDTPWTVRAGGASVNLAAGIMNVPMGDTPEDRHVRIHELLHARVTPADLLQVGSERGATMAALQGCEDGRLGRVAAVQGIDAYTYTAPIPADDARAMLRKSFGIGEDGQILPGEHDLHGGAALVMAATGTALQGLADGVVESIPDRMIRHMIQGTIEEARTALDPDVRDSAIDAALVIDRLYVPEDPEEEEGPGKGRAMGGDIPDQGSKDPAGCMADPSRVSVLRPPLPIMGAPKRARARKRSQDSGAMTRPAETLDPTGNGRPFSTRAKVPGGVVVIDVSGSMHPTHDQVRALVAAAPGAMILTYSSDREPDGRVIARVVGERGRIVAPDNLTIGGSNVNDASVLAWAAKHGPAGPRVWVSDGGAGNADGQISPGSMTYTRQVARRLGFYTVPGLAAALGSPA